MKLRSSWVLVFLVVFSGAAVAKDLSKLLPPTYRNWLNRDVAYIITDDERNTFLHLTSDDERDKFIDRFWEIRNDNPGAPVNTYKEEHYRRLAYADQWFGHGANQEGWRTDRGRVYITLGAPQQVGKYLGFANIRPMEIWFYSNGHPALPPFFYVVFYQRETGSDFRLYSPFMDGPEKLVTGPFENDRVSSWRLIDHDAGREVSRTVLSLIPTEPVDMDTATSSLTSDMMLNNIRGLANHPLNLELLKEKRNALEAVSHRVVLHGDYLDLLTVPLVDAAGDTNLHYVMRVKRPQDFSIGQDKDEHSYYAATVSAKVLTPEGTPIFSQERKLTHYLDDTQLARLKNGTFGYEGVLPLPPGKYKIQFQLTDDLQHTSFPVEREVVVPTRPAEGLRITEVVPFSEAIANQSPATPFTAAGVRFIPTRENLSLVAGQDLQFFYQLWEAAKAADSKEEGNLQVEYAYGRMGLHDTHTLSEEIARNQFDSGGTLINGKKIPTADLPLGDYRMAITVTDPATHERSVATFQFRVTDRDPSPPSWDVTDPQVTEDSRTGKREYDRGLCYISQRDSEHATLHLRNAFSKEPSDQTRDKLIEVLYSRQAFDDVIALYAHGGVTGASDEETVLQVAESLNRTGQVAKSIELLESALRLRQTSTLYLGLARYYQVSGDAKKATEMEQKGKSLAAQPTT